MGHLVLVGARRAVPLPIQWHVPAVRRQHPAPMFLVSSIPCGDSRRVATNGRHFTLPPWARQDAPFSPGLARRDLLASERSAVRRQDPYASFFYRWRRFAVRVVPHGTLAERKKLQ